MCHVECVIRNVQRGVQSAYCGPSERDHELDGGIRQVDSSEPHATVQSVFHRRIKEAGRQVRTVILGLAP